jgi:hypothetical protein
MKNRKEILQLIFDCDALALDKQKPADSEHPVIYDSKIHGKQYPAPLIACHLYNKILDLQKEMTLQEDQAALLSRKSTERSNLKDDNLLIEAQIDTLDILMIANLCEYLLSINIKPYRNYEMLSDWKFCGLIEDVVLISKVYEDEDYAQNGVPVIQQRLH